MINKIYKLAYIYVIAANLEKLFSELNLKEDVRNFLNSVNEENLRYYIPEIKKNPTITVEQLKSIIIPQKEEEKKRNNTEYEINKVRRFGSDEFKKWVLYWFRKLRATDSYSIFDNKLQEIYDWYFSEKPQIFSYKWDKAIMQADSWHEAIAKEGDDENYIEGMKNVVYGPQWKNKEYNGWTIRRIFTENDLTVEGNKMQHCVGSYADKVDMNSCAIYSLRDPQNQPHVTLEEEPAESGTFTQIFGKQNEEPNIKYKNILKEWFKTISNVKRYGQDDIDEVVDFSDISNYSGKYLDQTLESIQNFFDGETEDEYGINKNIDPDMLSRTFDRIIEAAKNRRDTSYTPNELIYTIELLTENAIDLATKGNKRPLSDIIYECQKLEEEKFDYYIDYSDNNYEIYKDIVKEEDYEDDDKYREALDEKMQKDFEKEYSKYIPWSLSGAVFKEVNEYMKNNNLTWKDLGIE